MNTLRLILFDSVGHDSSSVITARAARGPIPFRRYLPLFLKRLDLHGFKSFAHKTSIDFMQGVTIVVGPNGCGKSNVLDAIRWVLGETSAKSLRGAKMGDVVFRGSSSLKPAHFAQVNLVVNNEPGYLKVDQSEVMVSRRLFSNGDSEYLINKQKGRMCDVHELFLDTGLGADGYSIIEQGQIGQMVAAKPRERRDIFEEAAGISRYKARRDETMRKLVRTEEDLIRLFDIVSEVQRACNTLYRQARKAIRHRKLRKRLERLQKRLLVQRKTLLSTRLAEIESRLKVATNEFEQANSLLAAAEAKRAEAARLIEDYQRRAQEMQQERYDLQQAINREQRRIDAGRQTVQSVDERVQLLQREIASSSNRVAILSSTIEALDKDLARDREVLARDSAELDTAVRELESLRREHDMANSGLGKLRQELQVERAKEAKVQQDLKLSESLIERLSNELHNHEATVAQLRTEAEEAGAQATAARTEMETRRARLAELREEATRCKEQIAQGSTEKNDLATRLEQVTRQFNQAASRVNALEEVENSYEGFFRGVQVVMRASQEKRLNGIIGVLTNLLIVPKEYEIAIEVALGGSLQDIVTVSERDAQAAIRFLKERKEGRATFLPLDLLHSNVRYDQVKQILGRSGVVGLGRDLIEFDKQIEKAVERRIGNTVIVTELPVAIQLEREGFRNRYVSLDGDLVDPSGVLTGGSHKSRGFLSRGREIRDLREQANKLDAERKALHDKLAAMNDRLSQAHARAAELQAEIHETQMGETRSEKDLQSAEQRQKDRRNALASAEAREVQQRHDLRSHQERVEECAAALATLTAAIEVKEKEITDTESQGSSRSGRLEELSERVSGGRVKVGTLTERINGLSAKLNEVRTECGNAGNEQESRAAEQRELAIRREEAARDAAAAETLLADLVKQREVLEAAISQMEQENEASLKEARAGMSEVQGLQRDRNMKENTLREVEIQATETRTQAKLIEEEAQNEFACTIEELTAQLSEEMTPESDLIASPEGATEEADADEDDSIFEKDDAITDLGELRRLVNEMRDKISRMGAVNETAIDEFKEQKERLDFLTVQRDDLIAAKDSLTETIKSLDETTTKLFADAYTAIRANFQENFRRLFNGGKGDLVLVEEDGEPEPGIDIYAQPPGKNIGGSITLMSGGEKAMTAISLMLALFQYRPSPICILDEIDAPLDDVNCMRLCDALKEYSRTTQFLIITHNKITMGLADTIYGVTMQEPGISKLVSVKFDQIDESGLLESTG